MPLSEFHPATKGNLESNLQSDVSSFMPENDFAELLWNGQIMMQGQSNRPKRPNFSSVFPSILGRTTEEKHVNGSPKAGRIDPIANELSPVVPSTGLNSEEDDMVPWRTYNMEEDPLQSDYCSEFFSDYRGLNMNPLSNSNNFAPNVEHEHTMKPPVGGIVSGKTKLSRTSGVGGSNCNSNAQKRSQKEDAPTTKPLQTSSSAGVTNFSHFSRSAALAKANLLNVDRLRSIQRKPSPVLQLPLPPKKVELRSSVRPSIEAVNSQGGQDNAESCIRPPGYNARHSLSHTPIVAEKGPEVVVASSVCSGSSAGVNNLTPSGKRKNTEGDESGYQSEDLDDESIDIKKSAGKGVSAKRSRAAEVHNLSERRRRDRINDRMRALQELIPNCNKVDKASMLDEAIEYLKTLQLQVQIMSMGSGVCVPPMMLPNGMQHLRRPPMAHFPIPMSLGMGMAMGMGYGMGMLEMHGSPGWQFPSMAMPGSSNVQMLGNPGHCLGMGISQMAPHPPPPPFASFPRPQGDTAGQENINLDAAQKSSAVDYSNAHTSTQV